MLLAATAASSRDLHAQSLCWEPWEAGAAPTLVRDADGDLALGARLSAQACSNRHDTRTGFSRSSYMRAGLEGAVPFRSVLLPQNVEASAAAGLSVSLSERRPIDLDDDPDADFYRFNYGFAAVGGHLRYESSADGREHGAAGGVELRWVDPSRPYLPSLVASLEGVKPVGSRLRDGLGEDLDAHGRFQLRGYWFLPLPRAFLLEVDTGYFRAFGLDEVVEEVGIRWGGYVAPTLGYGLLRPMGPLVLESVFVGYAHGRRPTGTRSGRAWTVGLEVGYRRF